jgi:hypothetical protein
VQNGTNLVVSSSTKYTQSKCCIEHSCNGLIEAKIVSTFEEGELKDLFTRCLPTTEQGTRCPPTTVQNGTNLVVSSSTKYTQSKCCIEHSCNALIEANCVTIVLVTMPSSVVIGKTIAIHQPPLFKAHVQEIAIAKADSDNTINNNNSLVLKEGKCGYHEFIYDPREYYVYYYDAEEFAVSRIISKIKQKLLQTLCNKTALEPEAVPPWMQYLFTMVHLFMWVAPISMVTLLFRLRPRGLSLKWTMMWVWMLCLCMLPLAAASNSDERSSKIPMFDGTRATWMTWFIAVNGWIAWKLPRCVGIATGAEIVPAATGTNQDDIDNWTERNRSLYGAVLQALPDWLKTAAFLNHNGNGRGLIVSLEQQFAAQNSNDRAEAMARLGATYINPRNGLSEHDLRIQYDAMMVAHADIQRTGGNPMDEGLLISMFDNALPNSYSQIRLLVRRSQHNTLAAHFGDYLAQVKAELACRTTSSVGYRAQTNTNQNNLQGNVARSSRGGRGGRGGRGDRGGGRAQTRPHPICFNCLKRHEGGREACRQPKVSCDHCSGPHHSKLCPKGPGGSERDELTNGAMNILRAEAGMGSLTNPRGLTAAPRPPSSSSQAGSSLQHAQASAPRQEQPHNPYPAEYQDEDHEERTVINGFRARLVKKVNKYIPCGKQHSDKSAQEADIKCIPCDDSEQYPSLTNNIEDLTLEYSFSTKLEALNNFRPCTYFENMRQAMNVPSEVLMHFMICRLWGRTDSGLSICPLCGGTSCWVGQLRMLYFAFEKHGVGGLYGDVLGMIGTNLKFHIYWSVPRAMITLITARRELRQRRRWAEVNPGYEHNNQMIAKLVGQYGTQFDQRAYLLAIRTEAVVKTVVDDKRRQIQQDEQMALEMERLQAAEAREAELQKVNDEMLAEGMALSLTSSAPLEQPHVPENDVDAAEAHEAEMQASYMGPIHASGASSEDDFGAELMEVLLRDMVPDTDWHDKWRQAEEKCLEYDQPSDQHSSTHSVCSEDLREQFQRMRDIESLTDEMEQLPTAAMVNEPVEQLSLTDLQEMVADEHVGDHVLEESIHMVDVVEVDTEEDIDLTRWTHSSEHDDTAVDSMPPLMLPPPQVSIVLHATPRLAGTSLLVPSAGPLNHPAVHHAEPRGPRCPIARARLPIRASQYGVPPDTSLTTDKINQRNTLVAYCANLAPRRRGVTLLPSSDEDEPSEVLPYNGPLHCSNRHHDHSRNPNGIMGICHICIQSRQAICEHSWGTCFHADASFARLRMHACDACGNVSYMGCEALGQAVMLADGSVYRFSGVHTSGVHTTGDLMWLSGHLCCTTCRQPAYIECPFECGDVYCAACFRGHTCSTEDAVDMEDQGGHPSDEAPSTPPGAPLPSIPQPDAPKRSRSSAYVAVLGSPAAMIAATTNLPKHHPADFLLRACVDSGASKFFVHRPDALIEVTDAHPDQDVNMLTGVTPVTAIGIAAMHFRLKTGQWRRVIVADVHVVPESDVMLYSPSAMFEQHAVRHLFDDVNELIFPDGARVPFVRDEGGSYTIEVAFEGGLTARVGVMPPRPTNQLKSQVAECTACGDTGYVKGEPCWYCQEQSSPTRARQPTSRQLLLHRRLGFPYSAQWRHVPAQLCDSGVPSDASLPSDVPMDPAIARGRMRALRFNSERPSDSLPPPGAVLYLDFAGPLTKSHLHGYNNYMGIVDAGSGYCAAYPCHSQSADVARGSVATFVAELTAVMGLTAKLKPHTVTSDQGSAFVAKEFSEFVTQDIQASQQLACTYTPQQNAFVERMWGVTFGTARVLLCSANLDPAFHPWAMQTAVWLHNRLPQPGRGNKSPYFILARRPASVAYLRAFGCLVKALVPVATRSGDRHFSDRGVMGINLGPSTRSPGAVIYLPAFKKIVVTRHVVFYENEFPGVRGTMYAWFPADDHDDQRPREGGGGGGDDKHGYQQINGRSFDSTQRGFDETNVHGADYQAPTPVHRCEGSTGTYPRSPDRSQPTPARVNPGRALAFGNVEQSNDIRHPQADNPSSRHFERRHPQRDRGHGVARLDPNPQQKSYARYADPTHATLEQASRNYHTLAESERGFPAFAYQASLNTAAIVVSTTTTDLGDVPIPRNYREAVNHPVYGPYWRAAFNKELQGLIERRTWMTMTMDDLPAGANLMNCHCVWTVKRNSDGSVDKFKCRIVADGRSQKFGVDFDRVFATVVKLPTLRCLLAIACAKDYNLTSVDVQQAYLLSHVDKDLYMRVPPGMPRQDDKGRPIVLKILRGLYGLRQGAKLFNDLLTSFLLKWGFKQSVIDVCLFVYTENEGTLYIVSWVDDLVIADNNSKLRNRFVDELNKRFPIDDKGALEWVLGVKVTRERRRHRLLLSQELYVRDTLARFLGDTVGQARKFDSPLDDRTPLTHEQCPAEGSLEAERMSGKQDEYMSICGAILWLANVTRPELAFTASQLARFVSNPGEAHYAAAKRVLYYLHTTRDRMLVFQAPTKEDGHGLKLYVDSDWSATLSVSGAYIFFMGCLVAWFSKVQKSISLSSAESEYFGATLAAKEGLWLRDLVSDFGFTPAGPTLMYLDSKSAIDMSFDPIAFRKTKHILRAAHFFRDLVARRVFLPKHVAGTENVADLCTKALPRATFTYLVSRLLQT